MFPEPYQEAYDRYAYPGPRKSRSSHSLGSGKMHLCIDGRRVKSVAVAFCPAVSR
jgi:hypothetical protein